MKKKKKETPLLHSQKVGKGNTWKKKMKKESLTGKKEKKKKYKKEEKIEHFIYHRKN